MLLLKDATIVLNMDGTLILFKQFIKDVGALDGMTMGKNRVKLPTGKSFKRTLM